MFRPTLWNYFKSLAQQNTESPIGIGSNSLRMWHLKGKLLTIYNSCWNFGAVLIATNEAVYLQSKSKRLQGLVKHALD